MNSNISDILEAVKDPELPDISIGELGVLRQVEMSKNGSVVVHITPTYAGCPAMETITEDIISTLSNHGYNRVVVEQLLAPAWSSDWLSETARQKLKAMGIAPPLACSCSDFQSIQCPLCEHSDTEIISEYGSTACKAMYRCMNCQEVFDLFKTL